jgi:hypothetical protein
MSLSIQLVTGPGLNGSQCLACRKAVTFWNLFMTLEHPLTLCVDLYSGNPHVHAFTNPTIQCRGMYYSRIWFNSRMLEHATEFDLFVTLVHEIGHALTFKHDPRWLTLFNLTTGRFKSEYIDHLTALSSMTVETRHGTGARFCHWCSRSHPDEVMTVFRSSNPYILPVTIDVGSFLGHRIRRRLSEPMFLRDFYSSYAEDGLIGYS